MTAKPSLLEEASHCRWYICKLGFAFWETEKGEECTCCHSPCVYGAFTNTHVTPRGSYVLVHYLQQPYKGGTSVIFVLQVRKLRHGNKGTARSCNNSSQNSLPEEL